MALRYGQSSAQSGNRSYGRGDGEKKKRPTYAQDWPSYRLAQEFEGDFFRLFLSNLMDLVKEPQRTSAEGHVTGSAMYSRPWC